MTRLLAGAILAVLTLSSSAYAAEKAVPIPDRAKSIVVASFAAGYLAGVFVTTGYSAPGEAYDALAGLLKETLANCHTTDCVTETLDATVSKARVEWERQSPVAPPAPVCLQTAFTNLKGGRQP